MRPAPSQSARRLPPNLRIAAALLLAAAASALLVAVGVAGMTVSAAPRWVSLLVEPFSFFLLPGALYAWVEAGLLKVDFSSTTVVRACLLFYFLAFAILLLLRLRSHPSRHRARHTHSR